MRVGHHAVDVVEERLLQASGDRAAAAAADVALVDRSDGRDLGGRAREEQFVGHVQGLARDVFLAHFDAEIPRERDHAVARDAGQAARGERRRVEHAVADQEQVLAAAFTHLAERVERDGLAVPVEHGLHLDQLRVGVVGRRLRHRGERVGCGARPAADAHVGAAFQRLGTEICAPFPDENGAVDRRGQRVDAQFVVAAVDNRPDVAGLEAVGLDGVDHRLRDLLETERVLHAVDPRRLVQAPHVRVEPEEDRPFRGLVAARALENRRSVVNDV